MLLLMAMYSLVWNYYVLFHWDGHENWSDPRPNQYKEDLKKRKYGKKDDKSK